MALTFTKVVGSDTVIGNHRSVVYDIDFDSSYPAGGETVTPGNFGLSQILLMLVQPVNAAAGRLLWFFDAVNSKILSVFPSGGAAASPASLADPSVAVPSGGTAVTSTAAQPDLTETPGSGKEVGATADLSTCKVRAYVIGY